jgi:hypothetical protein
LAREEVAMADVEAGSDGSPRLRILSLGLEEEKELVASSPCREPKTEEQDGKGVAAEIGGDGELRRRSGGQEQELREATKTKTWCKGGSMSVGCLTREEEKERERGGPSPAVSFTSGDENKGGGAGWNWSSDVGRLRARVKGRGRGWCSAFIQTESGEGEAEGKVAVGGLAIHGRRLSRHKEARGGGNCKKLKRIWSWRFIALIGALGRKGEVEEVGRRGGDYGGRAAEQRKGRAREEGRADRWGRRVNDLGGERKGKDRWAAVGVARKGRQAGRELGQGGLKGERGEVESFLFFLLNLFKLKHFKFFSKFSKIF